MNLRSFQGLSLILSAILGLVGFFGPDTALFSAISTISVILFIIGIPAVYTAQPIGIMGLIGIILMILAAVIALGFSLLDIDISPTLENILFWTSAVGGLLGRVIVGWLTTRQRVFPAWAGWALLIEGLLNILYGALSLGSFDNVYTSITVLVGAIALLGYGFTLLRPRAAPAIT